MGLMGSSDEEYVEEYYRVRRRKDTHLADSSNDPDAKRGLLFNDEGLVTHADMYEVDEDELREQYSTHDIEYVYVEEERDEVKEAVAFAIAEVVVYVAKDVWDKHGDEIIAWVGDKAGRAADVVKRKASDGATLVMERHAARKENRAAKKADRALKRAERKRSKKGDVTVLAQIDSAYEGYRKDMDSDEAKAKLLRVIALAMELSAGIEELSHANIVGAERDEVLDFLSRQELVDAVNNVLEAGPSAYDEAMLASLQMMLGRNLYENGEYIPIRADEMRFMTAGEETPPPKQDAEEDDDDDDDADN